MPQLTVEIHDLATAGKWDRVKTILDEVVVPLYAIRNRRDGYKGSMIKMGMTLAGLKGGRVRAPLIEMAPEDVADLKKLMTRAGLLSQAVTA
jgi:5-dehydro-4-deoxyglucarate dehydratase